MDLEVEADSNSNQVLKNTESEDDTGIAYVNFVEEHRKRYSRKYKGEVLAQDAARRWNELSQSERTEYLKPQRNRNMKEDEYDGLAGEEIEQPNPEDRSMQSQDGEDGEDSCSKKKRKPSCKPKKKKPRCGKPKPRCAKPKPRCPKRKPKKKACPKPKPRCPKPKKKKPRCPKPRKARKCRVLYRPGCRPCCL